VLPAKPCSAAVYAELHCTFAKISAAHAAMCRPSRLWCSAHMRMMRTTCTVAPEGLRTLLLPAVYAALWLPCGIGAYLRASSCVHTDNSAPLQWDGPRPACGYYTLYTPLRCELPQWLSHYVKDTGADPNPLAATALQQPTAYAEEQCTV
jgi:hypothetical protein